MLCFTTFKIKIVNVTRTSLLFIPTWSYIRIWAWGKQKWRKLCACKLWLQLLQITIKFIPFTINLPFLVVPISSSSILRICSWADMFSLVATNCHKIYRQNLNEKYRHSNAVWCSLSDVMENCLVFRFLYTTYVG